MIFTASDVSSLAASLGRWEWAEYASCALVALGCTGEYIAEFTDCWTGGLKERKDRLAKRSTLLLISALALELMCLVKTNSISGMLIGSLSEKAGAAETKAQSAFDKSALAESKAGNASTLAGDALTDSKAAKDVAGEAQEKVGTVAKQADDLLTKYVKAEKELEEERKARAEYEAKNAPRRLSSEQANLIKSRMLRFKVWKINIFADGKNTEIVDFANDLEKVFRDAGFAVDAKQGMLMFEQGATPEQQRGFDLLIGANRGRDADVVIKAFRDAGLIGQNKPIRTGRTEQKDDLLLRVYAK
jgi:hypothetical protein